MTLVNLSLPKTFSAAERKREKHRMAHRVYRSTVMGRLHEQTYSRDYEAARKWRSAERRSEWNKANPEKARAAVLRRQAHPLRRERTRWSNLAHRLGITGARYDAMLAAQGGVCAICGCPPSGKRRHLAVDHDHVTGNVRGLLCTKCNTVLGHADDKKEILVAAIAYLELPQRPV